jgi:hypothetical protein
LPDGKTPRGGAAKRVEAQRTDPNKNDLAIFIFQMHDFRRMKAQVNSAGSNSASLFFGGIGDYGDGGSADDHQLGRKQLYRLFPTILSDVPHTSKCNRSSREIPKATSASSFCELTSHSICIRLRPKMKRSSLSLLAFLIVSASNLFAWDYEGHRLVNQIALASVSSNFPAFAITGGAQDRIAFLAGEPDRWRNTSSLGLKHFNGPDHYLDVDTLPLYGLTPEKVSHLRYEFAGQLYVARAQHPENFPAINPSKNEDKTRELVGFLPWTITEYYGKLKSEFSYLKTFEANGGTPTEIQNAQENIIYIMGVMGHFCGDAGQPLHTTKHHNGWVGENPNQYATNSGFHSWVDGGYIHKADIGLKEMKSRIRPAALFAGVEIQSKQEDIFPDVMQFVLAQNKLVAPLYQLNKEGNLSDNGQGESKGRAFITQQLITSGQFLGDLWFSAWRTAAEDSYLKSQLNKRLSPTKRK